MRIHEISENDREPFLKYEQIRKYRGLTNRKGVDYSSPDEWKTDSVNVDDLRRKQPVNVSRGEMSPTMKDYYLSFKKNVESAGYKPYYVRDSKGGYTFNFITKNNIIITLYPGQTARNFTLWIYGLRPDTKKDILYYLMDLGYQFPSESIENEKTPGIRVVQEPGNSTQIKYNSLEKILQVTWGLVKNIEEMGLDFSKRLRRTSSASKVQGNRSLFKFYLQVAGTIALGVYLKESGTISRAQNTLDLRNTDPNILIGITKKAFNEYKNDYDFKRHHEHAVPCKVIVDTAIDMFQSVSSGGYNAILKKIPEVAEMIRRNLLVVLSLPEEANYMDNKLNLKDKMPENWDPFSGNVLERFKAAKIPVYSLKTGKRLAENEITT